MDLKTNICEQKLKEYAFIQQFEGQVLRFKMMKKLSLFFR
jgi:hypothetical protein